MKKFLVLILGILLALPSYSMKIGGKNLPNTLKFGDAVLVLNGAGLRKKFWFKIYAGALYLPQKSKNWNEIVNGDKPMAIRMHFIYDGVSSSQMTDGWQDDFKHLLRGNYSKYAKQIKMFLSCFNVETHEDDIWDIVYIPGIGTKVLLNGKEKGVIPGLDFKKLVFSVFLSPKTQLPDLREEMLGID